MGGGGKINKLLFFFTPGTGGGVCAQYREGVEKKFCLLSIGFTRATKSHCTFPCITIGIPFLLLYKGGGGGMVRFCFLVPLFRRGGLCPI